MSQSSSVFRASQTSWAFGLIAALLSLQSVLEATSPVTASQAERAVPAPKVSESPSTYQLVWPVADESASSASVSQSSSVFRASQTSWAFGLMAALLSLQSVALAE